MDSSIFSDRNGGLRMETDTSDYVSDQSGAREQSQNASANNSTFMSGQWAPGGDLTPIPSNTVNETRSETVVPMCISSEDRQNHPPGPDIRETTPSQSAAENLPDQHIAGTINSQSAAENLPTARSSSPLNGNQTLDLSFGLSAILSTSADDENDHTGAFELVKIIEAGEKLIAEYEQVLGEPKNNQNLPEQIKEYRKKLATSYLRLDELLVEYPAFDHLFGSTTRNWEQVLSGMSKYIESLDGRKEQKNGNNDDVVRDVVVSENTVSNEEMNLMLVGDTRSGKSSFVNTISGRRDWKRVGNENWESTTTEVSECSTSVKGKSVNIYDTPGMNDSQLRLSNKQIKTMLEYHLSSTLTTGVNAFLIFESLQGEGVTLRRNLETLVEVFGPAVQKSCIVMLTKEPFNPDRAEYIQNICAQLSPEVPTVVWENSHKDIITGEWKELTQEKLEGQIQNLFSKIDQVQNYEIATLHALKNEVNAEANRRREAEPVQYEQKSYTVDVPYMEPEVINVTKQRPVVKDRWKSGRFGKITGIKETYVEYENYNEQQTIYHQKSKVETRYHQVALPKKPIEHYIEVIKKEKIKTFKLNLLK
ncbi:uncharacterized protein LOC142350309 isoform X3 [Convolutriloba macropyga]|uniref:uncharacterized protein LOC142350309 isoform X3 n=1 Tax=Convolutriloba macropyga TaxID=536237 RepID=UPI003F51D5C4